MRPKKGVHLLTKQELILLHLLENQSSKKDYEIPWILTEIGIAGCLKLWVGNVSRYLGALYQKGFVTASKGRPHGGKSRFKYFTLTPSGLERSMNISNSISKVRIELVTPEFTKNVLFNDIYSYLPIKPTMAEIASAVVENRLNVSTLMTDRTIIGTGLYRTNPETPAIERFFGRAEEMRILREWAMSGESAVLEVVGVAGIGKTTMLARATQDWLLHSHVFWYRIREYNEPWNIVHDIAIFLSALGKATVSKAISDFKVDLGVFGYALNEDLCNMPITFIFDDIHRANERVLQAIKVIADISLRQEGVKLATSSTKHVKIVDGKDYPTHHYCKVKLTGLDQDAAMHLLPSGIGRHSEEAEYIFKLTSGHPFLLQNAPLMLSDDVELSRYINEELIANLSDEEMCILKTLSLIRRPASKSDLIGYLRIDSGALGSLEDRGIVLKRDERSYEIHDLLRQHLAQKLADGAKVKLHEKIGQMYQRELGSVRSSEAIYHYTEAGICDKAADILVQYGDDIIALGLASSLVEQARTLLEMCERPDYKAAKLLHRVGDILESSGSWDEALGVYDKAMQHYGGQDEDGAKVMMKISTILIRQNSYAEAQQILEKALKLSSELNATELVAEIRCTLGNLFIQQCDYDRALSEFEEGLTFARKSGSHRVEGKSLYGIGRVEQARGNTAKSIGTKRKAADIFEAHGETMELSKVLTAIGVSYFNADELEKALEYHDKALKLCEKMGNPRLQACALLNVAGVMIEQNKPNRAERFLVKSLAMSEGLKEKRYIAATCISLAILALKTGEPKKALGYSSRSLTAAAESGVKYEMARADQMMGIVLMNVGQYSKAHEYLSDAKKKAISICETNLMEEIQRDLDRLASDRR
ncbi:MAG: tetratricopeptide repeat protein [Methanobacteriota archaeon]